MKTECFLLKINNILDENPVNKYMQKVNNRKTEKDGKYVQS